MQATSNFLSTYRLFPYLWPIQVGFNVYRLLIRSYKLYPIMFKPFLYGINHCVGDVHVVFSHKNKIEEKFLKRDKIRRSIQIRQKQSLRHQPSKLSRLIKDFKSIEIQINLLLLKLKIRKT